MLTEIDKLAAVRVILMRATGTSVGGSGAAAAGGSALTEPGPSLEAY